MKFRNIVTLLLIFVFGSLPAVQMNVAGELFRETCDS